MLDIQHFGHCPQQKPSPATPFVEIGAASDILLVRLAWRLAAQHRKPMTVVLEHARLAGLGKGGRG